MANALGIICDICSINVGQIYKLLNSCEVQTNVKSSSIPCFNEQRNKLEQSDFDIGPRIMPYCEKEISSCLATI